MSRQHGYYNIDFTGFFIGLVLFGAVCGAVLMWTLPIVWSWIKPIIHQLTA